MTDSVDGKPSNKVARLIRQYELDGLGEELRRYWTGEDVERMSLRDLSDYVNKAVLEAAMRRAGMSTLEQDVDTIYRNLTSDTVSAGVRTETENTLSEEGIDPQTLQQDFVSYQTVRTYLNEYQDVTYEGVSDEEKLRKDIDIINRLTTRSQTVAVDRIRKQMSTGRISATNFEVFVETSVLCQDCGSQYAADEFLEQGGCDCQRE